MAHCPQCGRRMRYIDSFKHWSGIWVDRYWCYSCRTYHVRRSPNQRNRPN